MTLVHSGKLKYCSISTIENARIGVIFI